MDKWYSEVADARTSLERAHVAIQKLRQHNRGLRWIATVQAFMLSLAVPALMLNAQPPVVIAYFAAVAIAVIVARQCAKIGRR